MVVYVRFVYLMGLINEPMLPVLYVLSFLDDALFVKG